MEANLLEDAALLKLAWVCLCALAALATRGIVEGVSSPCAKCVEAAGLRRETRVKTF